MALVSPSAHACQVTGRPRFRTSSIASLSACTTRCNSADVMVSGGISVTLSPIERSRTPRSTAAALTRRPQRNPPVGGASSTAPISPRSRTSFTAGFAATRSCRSPASSSERSRTFVSTSHASISSRWRNATAAASAFPPNEWPWYSVRSPRSSPRNASKTGPLAAVTDIGR